MLRVVAATEFACDTSKLFIHFENRIWCGAPYVLRRLYTQINIFIYSLPAYRFVVGPQQKRFHVRH